MPNVRAIMKRLKAVRNIRTITKTMEMASAARLQRNMKRQVASRPASVRVEEALAELIRSAGQLQHPLMEVRPGPVGLLVVTSQRGLCGGYNNQVLNTARREANQLRRDGRQILSYVMGKKGNSVLRFRARLEAANGTTPAVPEPTKAYAGIDENDPYQQASALADELIDAFRGGHVGSVRVAAMTMPSSGVFRPKIIPLLPVAPREGIELSAPRQFDLLPDLDELLDALLPTVVKIRLMAILVQAALAEQTARLMAMRSATSNADDMIGRLTMQINRVRQSKITTELSEIMGGAEALK